jgi:hypothetical protein
MKLGVFGCIVEVFIPNIKAIPQRGKHDQAQHDQAQFLVVEGQQDNRQIVRDLLTANDYER